MGMNMPVTALLSILISVSMSAVAQIALKTGMGSARVAAAMAGGKPAEMVLAIATQPFVILGLAIYVAGVLLWLYVLSIVDVSKAYPFVSLGFLLTLALGALVLGETVTPMRVVGTLVVCLGVYLVART